MKVAEKEALWAERVAAWKASGESMRRFAMEQGWTPRQLAYWKDRLAEVPRQAAPLVPVTIKPMMPAGVIRVIASGCSLELPATVPAAWLAELVRSL